MTTPNPQPSPSTPPTPAPAAPAPATAVDAVIKLSNVSKVYNLYRSKKDRMKEALHPRRKQYHTEFYALRDINLSVRRGESVGILGLNGAGKSTLLKIITRIATPTAGAVSVNGHMSALLELGSGFNPEFTGHENVFFYGALMGFTNAQMQGKIDEILEFADIGEYIYQPLKTYSSGMKSRLAFAVATSIEPDILILDEVLSVGDMFFQAKCTHRMQKMIKNQNTTVIFVSHSLEAVKAICQRSILLEGGKIIMDGRTEDVTNEYAKKMVQSRQKVIEKQIVDPSKNKANKKEAIFDNRTFLKKASFGRIQNGKAEFINVQLLDENETVIEKVEYGQNVILRMVLKINDDIDSLCYSYHILDQNGIHVIHGGSGIENQPLHNVQKGDQFVIDWRFCLQLMQGGYTIMAVVSMPIHFEVGVVEFCDYIPIACQFQMMIRNEARLYGFVCLNNALEVKKL